MTSEAPVPRVEPVDDERFLFVHDCHDLDLVEGQMKQVPAPSDHSYLPLGDKGWSWNADKTSLTPSIHCHRCGAHGFWTDGEWVPA